MGSYWEKVYAYLNDVVRPWVPTSRAIVWLEFLLETML